MAVFLHLLVGKPFKSRDLDKSFFMSIGMTNDPGFYHYSDIGVEDAPGSDVSVVEISSCVV